MIEFSDEMFFDTGNCLSFEDEMFLCTDEHVKWHDDLSDMEIILCNHAKQRAYAGQCTLDMNIRLKIKSLFNRLLDRYGIDPAVNAFKLHHLQVYLDEDIFGDGFLEGCDDYKYVISLLSQFCDENNTLAVCSSHFHQYVSLDGSYGSLTDRPHLHIVYVAVNDDCDDLYRFFADNLNYKENTAFV